MESTGKYWIPVFNLLEDDINVTIANPKWVKVVKGIRILREFTRYRYKLTSCRSSKKNRYKNALPVCNVALNSVVSDIFGKSTTSVIDYLIEQSDNSIRILCTIPGVDRNSVTTVISEIDTDMTPFSNSKRLCC